VIVLGGILFIGISFSDVIVHRRVTSVFTFVKNLGKPCSAIVGCWKGNSLENRMSRGLIRDADEQLRVHLISSGAQWVLSGERRRLHYYFQDLD